MMNKLSFCHSLLQVPFFYNTLAPPTSRRFAPLAGPSPCRSIGRFETRTAPRHPADLQDPSFLAMNGHPTGPAVRGRRGRPSLSVCLALSGSLASLSLCLAVLAVWLASLAALSVSSGHLESRSTGGQFNGGPGDPNRFGTENPPSPQAPQGSFLDPLRPRGAFWRP